MNIKLHYIEQGKGYPIILLHGNGEDYTYFRNQIEEFSIGYRVIAVDTRGHGLSPRGTLPLTLEQCAVDLYNFMIAHSIDKAHILGFSDGANIALLFALKHTNMVNRLVLNGADLFTTGVRALTQIPIELGYRLVSLISFFDKKVILKKEILGLMVGQPDIKPEELNKLPNPSLVIVGTNDLIKDKHSALIAESLSDCSFVHIPGNHFIALQNSKQFNTEVLKFLSDK